MRYFTAAVIVPTNPSIHKIEKYLEKRLEIDAIPDAISDALLTKVLRIIPEIISEMRSGALTVRTPCIILY